MTRPDWLYSDVVQVGIDFGDEGEVASYDDRQSASTEEDTALVERIGIGADDEAADIGCGTGMLACELGKRCRLVHAVDISGPMLRATMRRAASAGLTNVRPWQSSFLTFELPDASLALVTSKFALHHLPDLWKGMALARVLKALRPGGRFFLRDVVFQCLPAEVPETAERWIAWMQANTGYARAGVSTHIRDEHSTYAFIMEALIERAGFRIVRTEYSMGIYADYLAEKPRD